MYSKYKTGNRKFNFKLPVVIFQINSISSIESEKFRETLKTLPYLDPNQQNYFRTSENFLCFKSIKLSSFPLTVTQKLFFQEQIKGFNLVTKSIGRKMRISLKNLKSVVKFEMDQPTELFGVS